MLPDGRSEFQKTPPMTNDDHKPAQGLLKKVPRIMPITRLQPFVIRVMWVIRWLNLRSPIHLTFSRNLGLILTFVLLTSVRLNAAGFSQPDAKTQPDLFVWT